MKPIDFDCVEEIVLLKSSGAKRVRGLTKRHFAPDGEEDATPHSGYLRRLLSQRDRRISKLEGERLRVQNQREQELSESLSILHALKQGVVGLDLRGSVLFMNPSAETLLGFEEKALLGKNFHTLIHSEGSRALPCISDNCPLLELMHSGQQVVVDSDHFVNSQNKTLQVSYSGACLLKHNEQIGWLISFEDIALRTETSNAIGAYANQIESQNIILQVYCEKVAVAQQALQSQKDELSQLNEEMALMNRQLQGLAITDGMTGLPNHREFQSKLRSAWHGDRRRCNVKLMSILMVDVDYFKQYNDHFGHPAGDEALKTVANLLGNSIRSSDLLARYGGEEFVIIAWDTDVETAAGLANRLCQVIEDYKFPHRKVTISVGVATHDIRAETPSNSQAWYVSPDALIRAADDALYAAKKQGRNRSCCIGQVSDDSLVLESGSLE